MFTKLGHGDAAYAASMSLILLVVTIPFMTLVLPWMLSLLNVPHAGVDTWHLLEPLLGFLLLPLLIGLAIRWRYPGLAQQLVPHFSQVALVGVALHITLMFVAFWGLVVDEVHTGEYLYSIFMPAGCLIVGYGVCLLFMRSTAQKGSQAPDLQPHLRDGAVPGGRRGRPRLIRDHSRPACHHRRRDRQTPRQAPTPAGQPSHHS